MVPGGVYPLPIFVLELYISVKTLCLNCVSLACCISCLLFRGRASMVHVMSHDRSYMTEPVEYGTQESRYHKVKILA